MVPEHWSRRARRSSRRHPHANQCWQLGIRRGAILDKVRHAQHRGWHQSCRAAWDRSLLRLSLGGRHCGDQARRLPRPGLHRSGSPRSLGIHTLTPKSRPEGHPPRLGATPAVLTLLPQGLGLKNATHPWTSFCQCRRPGRNQVGLRRCAWRVGLGVVTGEGALDWLRFPARSVLLSADPQGGFECTAGCCALWPGVLPGRQVSLSRLSQHNPPDS